MKKYFAFIAILALFALSVYSCSAVAEACHIPPILGAIVAVAVFAIDIFKYYTTLPSNGGVAQNAQILPQYWTNIFLDIFWPKTTFIKRAMDMTAFAKNDGINIDELGTDPEVYIDPTGPISTVDVMDDTHFIPFRTFHTQNTAIKWLDQLQTIWNKAAVYLQRHTKRLYTRFAEYFLYNVAPNANTTLTPIINTTGAANGANNFKRIKITDIIALQQAFDEANMPEEGRVIVLSTKHKADLLLEDSAAYRSFLNAPKQGDMPSMLYGFEVYSSTLTPLYDNTTGAKIPFNATPTGNECHASIAWLEREVWYAEGDPEFFHRTAQQDPENRKETFGMAARFLAMPVRNAGIAAIVSRW